MFVEGKQSLLSRVIPEVLKRPFAIKAESLDNFSYLIQREGATEVNAFAGRTFRKAKFMQSQLLIALGEDVYFSYLFAQSRTGRTITLQEIFIEESGARRNVTTAVSESQERTINTARALYTSYQRLKELKERNPDLIVHMKKPDGRNMNELEETRLLDEVKKLDVESFPESARKK